MTFAFFHDIIYHNLAFRTKGKRRVKEKCFMLRMPSIFNWKIRGKFLTSISAVIVNISCKSRFARRLSAGIYAICSDMQGKSFFVRGRTYMPLWSIRPTGRYMNRSWSGFLRENVPELRITELCARMAAFFMSGIR